MFADTIDATLVVRARDLFRSAAFWRDKTTSRTGTSLILFFWFLWYAQAMSPITKKWPSFKHASAYFKKKLFLHFVASSLLSRSQSFDQMLKNTFSKEWINIFSKLNFFTTLHAAEGEIISCCFSSLHVTNKFSVSTSTSKCYQLKNNNILI